jgi:RNA polymerase primary sigma factor/RNA polymerase nonessential primary-like sigma factor
MSEGTEDRNDPYRDGNDSLFVQRNEIKAELAELERDEQSMINARRIRMLRRRLDDVTTEIVRYNLGLVRSYTRRFKGMASATDREEFEAAGMLGLMRAVDSYDPACGGFGQWAFKPIQREVLRSVRDVDHSNLNHSDFEKRPAILRAFRQLQGIDESYVPSDAEVAAAACVTVAQVRRVLAPPQVESMNRPFGDESAELADQIVSNDAGVEARVVSRMTLSALETVGLRALDARELYVVVRRFGLDGEPAEKLADIGASLALSREAVRQIESKALAKLQHPIVLRKLAAAEMATV